MLGRNLHLCFSLIRRPLSPEPTPDDSDHLDRPFSTAGSSPPSVLDTATTESTTTFDDSSTDSEPSEAFNFEAALASQRLFFSEPGRSKSIVDSGPARPKYPQRKEWTKPKMGQMGPEPLSQRDSGPVHYGPGGSVAVPTDSPDPYLDFRRSMEEMVEAREGAWDLEYLHELLLCYLALNPKSAHEFIIGAFSDLLVGLLPERVDRPPVSSGFV